MIFGQSTATPTLVDMTPPVTRPTVRHEAMTIHSLSVFPPRDPEVFSIKSQRIYISANDHLVRRLESSTTTHSLERNAIQQDPGHPPLLAFLRSPR